jgi:hypothetical protein
MKYIKKFEKQLNYKEGDYVLPQGDNPKDSYSIIDEVRGGSFGDYMISTYNIYTNKQIEHFPIMDNEIVRKLTDSEIEDIKIKRDLKKYNL